MRKIGLIALVVSLAACSKQVAIELPAAITLNHQYDDAIQQQIKLLQANQVKVWTHFVNANGLYQDELVLDVMGIRSNPAPDTLRQQVRKLAHLLVINLSEPNRYKAVNVSVSERRGLFEPDITLQFSTYSLASLR